MEFYPPNSFQTQVISSIRASHERDHYYLWMVPLTAAGCLAGKRDGTSKSAVTGKALLILEREKGPGMIRKGSFLWSSLPST